MWCGSIITFLLRGRRSIWCGCTVMPVAPRIVNDVSYVMRINHHIPFAWQAQYLVRLEWDSCRSAHSKWRFICDAETIQSFLLRGRRTIWWGWRESPVALRIVNDVSYVMRKQYSHSFCVAGAAFGEVAGWCPWLCALSLTFHTRDESIMTFLLRGNADVIFVLAAWIGVTGLELSLTTRWCWRLKPSTSSGSQAQRTAT